MSSSWKERLSGLGLTRRRRTGPAGARPAGPGRPPTTPKGRAGEEEAARFLEARGVSVLARNVRAGGGEIDLVAAEGRVVVFVEVKWRRDASRGAPAEAVTPGKRRKLLSAARAWLAENPAAGSRDVRFDVVAIEGETGRTDWIRGAFDAT
ncbi:MAG: YraN family protein [Thermoanaerobaculia bacterium]